MKIKISALLTLFLFFHTICFSQVKLKAIFSYDYSYGIATGDLHDFAKKNSFPGFHFHFRYFLKRDFSVGVSAGWNNFKTELPRALYETERGTVSAVQTRYFNSVPILAAGYYYMRSLHHVMPYVGGGVGPYFTTYEKNFGVVPFRERKMNLGVRPEVGLIFPFKETGLGLVINGRYNQVLYSHEEVDNLGYFEIGLGLYFGYALLDDSYSKE